MQLGDTYLFLFTASFLLLGCDIKKEGWLTYESNELGIAFDYPKGFEMTEFYTDEGDLNAVTFEYPENFGDESAQRGSFQLHQPEARYQLENCDSVTQNDPKQQCQMMMVKGHPLVMLDETWLDLSKTIEFETKKGRWNLASGNPELFENLVQTAQSLRYLN